MRMLVLVIAVCSFSGCALPPRLQAGGGTGPGYKTVSAKYAPSTLVAFDGSECRVTAGRFERTQVGDRIWCFWRERGDGGGPGLGPVGGPDSR